MLLHVYHGSVTIILRYTFKRHDRVKTLQLHVTEQLVPPWRFSLGKKSTVDYHCEGALKAAIKATFIIVWAEIYLFIATYAKWAGPDQHSLPKFTSPDALTLCAVTPGVLFNDCSL